MGLVLTQEQQLLRDAAKNFCTQHAPVSVLRHLRDSADSVGYDQALWQQMVELGWPGMAISETFGGFDFGYSGLGIVLEECGRTLLSSPLIASVLLGAAAINRLGTSAQKKELLPKIVSGELILAFAHDEGPVHRPGTIATTANRQAEHYVLEGRKCFVLDGHMAQKILVVARTSGATDELCGRSVFVIHADQSGVSVQRTQMVDSRNCANVVLKNVVVGQESQLGGAEISPQDLDLVLDTARIGLSAEMLGSALEVFERTVDYLKQREQFGVLIGSFQALQHRAAIMYSELELCRSAVLAALAALDDPQRSANDIARLASISKAKLSETAELVSNEGVQMHGGIGMTDEFDIGFFLKRARVAQQFLGDASFHRDRYATLNQF
ncbi:MAG: acyl-CoA/acyl-ACP dehydrogenase [Gammaproteobacteria bacterium]|nr:acyl-CoA/acyl-ACP dehydrogenase [Gammaproteobacteria bacterium]